MRVYVYVMVGAVSAAKATEGLPTRRSQLETHVLLRASYESEVKKEKETLRMMLVSAEGVNLLSFVSHTIFMRWI